MPVITGLSTGTNPFQTIERKDIGIKLKVTPQINEGDSIQLTIEQEVSSIKEGVAGVADIVTDKRFISPTVLIDDGGVITLGGLIEEDIEDVESKVPLLGDIPFLGRLFSSRSSTRTKRTLMVFIRPTIIRSQSIANDLSRNKYNYIHAQQILANAQGTGLYSRENDTLENWQRQGAISRIDLTNRTPGQSERLPAPLAPADIPIIDHSFQASKKYKKAR